MDKCSACAKKAHHPDNIKKSLSNRLNRINGQIKGVSKMIENDTYCDNVLNQITSIEKALNGVKKKLLEAHIKSCVIEQIQEGKIEVIDELMSTIKRMLK